MDNYLEIGKIVNSYGLKGFIKVLPLTDNIKRYELLNDFIGDKLKYRNYKNIKKFDDFILENNNSQISVNKELFLRIKKNKIFFVEHNNYGNRD